MPLVGIQYGASQLRWTEAMQLAREDENFAYPPPLLAAMQDNREDSIPTASVIAGCLRQFALKRRVEYYERPNGLLPPIFGTAFHSYMELYTEHDPGQQAFPDDTSGPAQEAVAPGPRHKELLLRATVDLGLPGYTAVPVTGRCDYLHEGVLLRDWKSKKYIPKGFKPPRENQTQVNIYNWLASEDGYTPAKKWELVYVSQDWVQRFRRPMKDVKLVKDYVVDRLRIWAAAELGDGLPAPVPAFFAEDAGKVPFPCSHCPVREACLAAFREETEAPF